MIEQAISKARLLRFTGRFSGRFAGNHRHSPDCFTHARQSMLEFKNHHAN
jgi:hypothetical protein